MYVPSVRLGTLGHKPLSIPVLPSSVLIIYLCLFCRLSYRKHSITCGIGKGKFLPIAGHEVSEGEQMYSPTFSLTSGLGGWVVNVTPLARYLLLRPGGPQDRYRRVLKISPPTGIRSPDRPARSESLYRLSYPGPHFDRVATS